MRTRARRKRVLHSMAAPGSETRYADHMAALSDDEFEMVFFTWSRALLGRYDVFHVHWPEQLLGSKPGVTGWIRWLQVQALLRRLRRRKIPVVYTLHNHAPHESLSAGRVDRLRDELARLTRLEIHLVPEPTHTPAVPTVSIPHGSYREPFAGHERSAALPGRLTYFGIIKPYKGVARLLEVFQAMDAADLTLRIAGEARDARLVRAITEAVERDERITARFGFIPDAELVKEVTQAELVVLPYEEFHSSGAALVALSLDRPILVPASPTTTALRDEVGAEWVHVYEGPLTASAIRAAFEHLPTEGRPNLDGRDWARVRDAHAAAYRRLTSPPPRSGS